MESHRHAVPPDHVVGFYRDEAELTDAVADFLAEGLARDSAVAVIATQAHRSAIAQALASRGYPSDVVPLGAYESLDAAELLATFMRVDGPDAESFAAAMDSILDRLSDGGRRTVRVFGEMVALLWTEGRVAAAIDLESLWNQLASRRAFALYCGYPLAGIVASDNLGAAKRLCDEHANVFPLERSARPAAEARADADEVVRWFVPSPAALSTVRRHVEWVLREWNREALVPDALLVTGELAANAIAHASSPFVVTLSTTPSSLRVAVRDAGAVGPEVLTRRVADPRDRGGRGLSLVEAVATAWGIGDEPDGKTIWAELETPVAAPGGSEASSLSRRT